MKSLRCRNSRIHRPKSRRGAAVVELAVCIPVLALIVFGSLSATSMIFLRAALVQSAYETVKETVRLGGSESQGREQGRRVLEFRNITTSSVSFSPSNVDNQAKGTPITVTVRADSSNRFFTFGPFAGQTIEVQATMNKE